MPTTLTFSTAFLCTKTHISVPPWPEDSASGTVQAHVSSYGSGFPLGMKARRPRGSSFSFPTARKRFRKGEGTRRIFRVSCEVSSPPKATEEVESPTLIGTEMDPPQCLVFDYGFQADFLRNQATVPGNVFTLAWQNFGREWRALRRNILYVDPPSLEGKSGPLEVTGAVALQSSVLVLRALDRVLTAYDGLTEITPPKKPDEAVDELRIKLGQLKLDNAAIWRREHARPAVKAPWWILAPYYALCWMLDVIYDGRPIQRFWFLETVARMPYFSYISMLHLYETLGWWQTGTDVRKVHFAEEWNEMHHLKIMESLGGNRLWVDRFFGQHAAFFYYWVLNGMFLVSPKVAYNFSELIESHAVDTYGEFVDANEELLKTLPPSPVAMAYYEGDDLYMFDEFQTSRPAQSRRVSVRSLYDVFCNIRDDESEHVKTMVACQQLGAAVVSPNKLARMQAAAAAARASVEEADNNNNNNNNAVANGAAQKEQSQNFFQRWLSQF